MSKLPLATDVMLPAERLLDTDVFLIHWAGGLQSARADTDRWRLLPIFHADAPHVNGFYSKAALRSFMSQRNQRFIAFQKIFWVNGAYNSSWSPFIPGQSNFHQSPADLWGNIASNLAGARTRPLLQAIQSPTTQEIDEILDAQSESERLAHSISLSLRNLDNSVEQIASFYNEELTNLLASGGVDGLWSSSMRDQSLYAQVQSFFLHLGSARDYLGALMALQLKLDPHKTDSMAKLVDTLRGPNISGSPILRMLEAKGYLQPIGAPSTKWEAVGWLERATDLRNEFVHRRTYGHTMAESMGQLRVIDSQSGLYRYFRPISKGTAGRNVFDVILDHYENLSELFFSTAQSSGYDISMLSITDEDIISVDEGDISKSFDGRTCD